MGISVPACPDLNIEYSAPPFVISRRRDVASGTVFPSIFKVAWAWIGMSLAAWRLGG
jgi:hypothetical protein